MRKPRKFRPGAAFADSLDSGKLRRLHAGESVLSWWTGHGRILVFSVVLFLTFFLLTARLFTVTIIEGHRYRLVADGNRTRELVRHAPRGIIYDRAGNALTQNYPRYKLIRPCAAGSAVESGKPCTEYITEEAGRKLAETGLSAGEYLESDFQRFYQHPEAVAHVVGYIGEVTAPELADQYFQLRGYTPGDRLGRDGAEAVFEDKLRGRNGRELVEVDAAGFAVRTLGVDRELPGTDIYLSVDAALSEAVHNAFPAEFDGAVVVTKPSTGEILALYSHPSYDPNSFADGAYSALAADSRRPLFNRAVGGVYPPGSTFKIVTSIAGLETGAFTRQTTVEDTGIIHIGQFSFANWYFTQYGRTEGQVNVVRALERSNDIYFYLMGEKIGITALSAWAKKFGIGRLTGIELAGEATGLMPDPAWKARRFSAPSDREARNDLWYAGDTYHVAIGQGYLLTTPLQVALWTNVIASGGKLCKPTIEMVGKAGHEARCFDLGISENNIKTIEEGLRKACESGGTGYPFFNFGIPDDPSGVSSGSGTIRPLPVACKTGTAETGSPDGSTHAWFTVYAPLPAPSTSQKNDGIISGLPEISVTVLVENGGEGSRDAAPVAREILLHWFGR